MHKETKSGEKKLTIFIYLITIQRRKDKSGVLMWGEDKSRKFRRLGLAWLVLALQLGMASKHLSRVEKKSEIMVIVCFRLDGSTRLCLSPSSIH